MKSLKIVGIVVSLLVFSLSLVQGALAAPISPPSEGCAGFNTTTPVASLSFHYGPKYFYDDDTIYMTTTAPANFEITNYDGLDQTFSNTTSAHLNIPESEHYTISVTAVRGVAFRLTAGCTSTPISSGCIVSNSNWATSFHLQDLDYNAGEKLHVTGSGLFTVTVSVAAAANFSNVTDVTYTFPVTGTYNITIRESQGGSVTGEVTCTLPHSILH